MYTAYTVLYDRNGVRDMCVFQDISELDKWLEDMYYLKRTYEDEQFVLISIN